MSSQYEKRKNKDVKEVVLNGLAYDVVYNEVDRQYLRINVAYDLKTGEAKVVSTRVLSDNQPVTLNKMKELFTRKILKLPFD